MAVVDFKTKQLEALRKKTPVWKPTFLDRKTTDDGVSYDWFHVPDAVRDGPSPMLIGVLPERHAMLDLMTELHAQQQTPTEQTPAELLSYLENLHAFVANVGILNAAKGTPYWTADMETQWQTMMKLAWDLAVERQQITPNEVATAAIAAVTAPVAPPKPVVKVPVAPVGPRPFSFYFKRTLTAFLVGYAAIYLFSLLLAK
jgi:hypothetical protein